MLRVCSGIFFLLLTFFFTACRPKSDDGLSVLENFIPSDVLYLLRADSPREVRKQLSGSHLMTQAYLSEFNRTVLFIDSITGKNADRAALWAAARTVVFSTHPLPGKKNDYAFLTLIDFTGSDFNFEKLTETIKELQSVHKFKLKSDSHKGTEIAEITFPDKQTLALAVKDRIVAVSYSPFLVKKALETAYHPSEQPGILPSAGSGWQAAVRWGSVNKWWKVYGNEEERFFTELSGVGTLASAEITPAGDGWNASGIFRPVENVDTYLNAVRTLPAGKREAHKILSRRTAVSVSLLFDKYLDVYLQREKLAEKSPAGFAAFREEASQAQTRSEIDVKTDFLPHVSGEITLAASEDANASGKKEKLLLFRLTDPAEARTAFLKFGMKENNKNPYPAAPMNYKQYEIRKWETKGLFTHLFGNLWRPFEKSYYTYIDGYAVLAPETETLTRLIDDFESGKTLAEDPDFQDFSAKTSETGHFFFYMAPRKSLGIFRYALSPASRKAADRNDPYFSAAKGVGIMLKGSADEANFRLTVRLLYRVNEENESEPLTGGLSPADSLALRKDLPDGPYEERYKKDKLKIKAYFLKGKLNGDFKSYFRNGQLQTSGRFREGKKADVWLFYNSKGKLLRKETYNEKYELIKTQTFER